MQNAKPKPPEPGALEKLASRGEGALKRLYDELDRNERTHDALHRVVETRGRIEKVSAKVLRQLGIASSDEVEQLAKEVHRLERRLARVEKDAAQTARPGGAADGA
jgi:hypothetical protein